MNLLTCVAKPKELEGVVGDSEIGFFFDLFLFFREIAFELDVQNL